MDCPICRERYTDPRVLSCGHTFCNCCLIEWRKHQPVHIIKIDGFDDMIQCSCPVCRSFIVSTPDDVFPPNFAYRAAEEAANQSAEEAIRAREEARDIATKAQRLASKVLAREAAQIKQKLNYFPGSLFRTQGTQTSRKTTRSEALIMLNDALIHLDLDPEQKRKADAFLGGLISFEFINNKGWLELQWLEQQSEERKKRFRARVAKTLEKARKIRAKIRARAKQVCFTDCLPAPARVFTHSNIDTAKSFPKMRHRRMP